MKIRITKVLLLLSSLPLIGGLCLRLACKIIGPYKARRQLALLSARPFVSPYADILCPDLQIGNLAFIDDHVTIYAHPSGGGVRIGPESSIQRYSILELTQGGTITIGQNTHIQSGCHLTAAKGNIHIGDHVQIAPRCAFYPYQHGFSTRAVPVARQPLTSRGDIIIEDDVWLGVGAIILDGVTVGQGAIIAAGAVVRDDVPAYAIAGGVPARVLALRPHDS